MNDERLIFHLSIPVHDLDEALAFYQTAVGAVVGRRSVDWLDVLMWGHQVTLQLRPDEVLGPNEQGKRHFGVVLPWSRWRSEADRLRSSAINFLSEPHFLHEGTEQEQAKFYLQDPSNNVIEVKAYKNFERVLGANAEGYTYDGT